MSKKTIPVIERSAKNCEKRMHSVIRSLRALIVPHATIRCQCETCGYAWYETYIRREDE